MDYIRDTDFLYMCKEPREEMVLVDDLFQRQFYVYVRDKYFCVYVKGRKKPRKEGRK